MINERTIAAMDRIPVINCISNIVTANDCANILLAAGFSPIMADEPEEMEDIAKAADACVINLGTPSDRKYKAALIAGRAYNRLKKPVILDPVGVAVSSYRSEHAGELLKNMHPDVIRCNLNEAEALIGMAGNTNELCGIDSRESLDQGLKAAPDAALRLAAAFNCTVLISGAVDVISDGLNIRTVSGGSDRLKQITGSGCMLSALIGGYCAAAVSCGELIYDAVCRASEDYKRAAERAEKLLSDRGGTGELRMRLIDAAGTACRINV